MDNKEILKQYLGDEVFERFDSMATQDTYEQPNPRYCVISGFSWNASPEGDGFWREIAMKLEGLEWSDLLPAREISKKEHKLLLQMFLSEYMGWIVPEDPVYYDMGMEESTLFKRVFDLVWEE